MDLLADAFILQDWPDTNFGDRGRSQVAYGTSGERYTLLSYDLRGISGSVTNAQIKMFATDHTNGPIKIRVHPMALDWGEYDVTWTSAQPSIDFGTIVTTVWSPSPLIDGGINEMIFDISNHVNQLLSSTPNGDVPAMALALVAEPTSSGGRVRFYGADGNPYGLWPTLNIDFNPEYRSPYTESKFSMILEESHLQAPYSSPLAASSNYLTTYQFSDWFFHLTDQRTLLMKMSGDGRRSELHHDNIWDSGSTETDSARINPLGPNGERNYKAVSARLRMAIPSSDVEQVTLVQIHHHAYIFEGLESGPLLRLHYRASDGSLSANVRTSAIPKTVQRFVILDTFPDNEWFDLEVRVFQEGAANSNAHFLTIVVNGQEKFRRNISYWAGQYSYFKAGNYLVASDDSDTEAVVEFEELDFFALDEFWLWCEYNPNWCG